MCSTPCAPRAARARRTAACTKSNPSICSQVCCTRCRRASASIRRRSTMWSWASSRRWANKGPCCPRWLRSRPAGIFAAPACRSTAFGPRAWGLVPRGMGADLIATLDGLRRADIDAFALESQRRASAARAAGYFAHSVVPVRDFLGQTILDEDEFIKPQTTLEGLAALKPSFETLGGMGFDAVALQRYPQVERIAHVHHAGNSSGIVDGAAAVLIGNEAA